MRVTRLCGRLATLAPSNFARYYRKPWISKLGLLQSLPSLALARVCGQFVAGFPTLADSTLLRECACLDLLRG